MWKAFGAGLAFVFLLLIGAGYLGYQSYNDDYATYATEQHPKKSENQLQTKEVTADMWKQEDAMPASTIPQAQEVQTLVATARGETVEALVARMTGSELIEVYNIAKAGIDEEAEKQIHDTLEKRFTTEEIDTIISFGLSEMEHMMQ
ncbi:hypothetical protein [Bacillus sp. JCM 19034]|uniref:hypothetical protein n=1 Tax=Bacillus sp. JCM 19034 TaxID=1481928 RepID=UPI0007830E52|nr:hypothetical protein [Bacillus sp. JCM 19034]